MSDPSDTPQPWLQTAGAALTRHYSGAFTKKLVDRLADGVSTKVNGKRLYVHVEAFERSGPVFSDELTCRFRLESSKPPKDIVVDWIDPASEIRGGGTLHVLPDGGKASTSQPRLIFRFSDEQGVDENIADLVEFIEMFADRAETPPGG